MPNYSVPFISNTPDDKHCLQASYAMIRNYFQPQSEFTWDEWSRLTGFVPGKGTWSMAGLMWFKDHGYDVAHVGKFDYRRFGAEGAKYQIEALGEEKGRWEVEFATDMPVETARALRFAETGIWQNRVPTVVDIYEYLDAGYLVNCLVNLNALNNRPGYLGHSVVVKGYTATAMILHDPGLPARENVHVPLRTFFKAWVDPLTHAEKLDAIRKTAPVPAALA